MPTSTAAKSPAGQSSKSTAALRPKEAFQDLILTLQQFWGAQGCVILQPYDMEVGAGTFHPATTLRALGPKPWSAAYVPLLQRSVLRYIDTKQSVIVLYDFRRTKCNCYLANVT